MALIALWMQLAMLAQMLLMQEKIAPILIAVGVKSCFVSAFGAVCVRLFCRDDTANRIRTITKLPQGSKTF